MSRIRSNRLFLPALVATLLGVLLGSCAVNPATGKRQLMLMSEAGEIAMGREAHPQIMASMGVYDDQGVQEYVAELGAELAALSERPNLPWTFTVLDDPAVNAFALPGGFIYVTRGIMTHLDSEAELVSVLGHEIGHVTGRHGAARMSKAQLMQVGLGVGMIVSPELQQFGDLAMQSMQLLFLKYSRDDERQADDLGLRYTVAGGWDAREMPEVFGVLKSVGEAAGAGRVPGWLSTHPDPGERQ
ncbi:MAG: M48 family metallopeptidase, partial [Acidobacteriota bacterium]|nr:M48 family metallopeptidase [Acidobacteriota bacterium]